MSEDGDDMLARRAKPPKRSRARAKERQGRKLSDEEIASLMAHVALHGRESGAKKFNVALRTIDRWKKRLADGSLPEVARLVDEQKRNAVGKNRDLLVETFSASLQALQTALPSMKGRDIVGAVKIVGELVQGRDMLNPPDEQPDRENQSSSGAEEGARSSAARARRTAGEEAPTDPIH